MPSYRRAPDEAVVTQTTTAASGILSASGVSLLGTIGSTGGGSANWQLSPPIPGKRKYIISANNTTIANTVIAPSSSAVTFDGTNGKLTFSAAANAAIELIGLTSTRWSIMYSTNVTVGSS